MLRNVTFNLNGNNEHSGITCFQKYDIFSQKFTCTNYFLTSLHKSYVAWLGLELTTQGLKPGYKTEALSSALPGLYGRENWTFLAMCECQKIQSTLKIMHKNCSSFEHKKWPKLLPECPVDIIIFHFSGGWSWLPTPYHDTATYHDVHTKQIIINKKMDISIKILIFNVKELEMFVCIYVTDIHL